MAFTFLSEPSTVPRANLPCSSMERQRRDIENTRQEIEVRYGVFPLGI